MQVARAGFRMPVRFAKTGMVVLCCLLLLLAPRPADGVDREQEAKLDEECRVQGETISIEYSGDEDWDPSFADGDWIQESGKSFLPYVSFESSQEPVQQFATFFPEQFYKGMGSRVRGVLTLSMTTSLWECEFRSSASDGRRVNEHRYFRFCRGFSELSIAMEGHFIVTRTQRVLCMHGCTVRLPAYSALDVNSTTEYTWNDRDKDQQDCSYFLQLHYPRTLSLATRVVRGKLRSRDGSFADMKISSLITINSAIYPYHFDAQNLIASTCNEASVTASVQERNVYRGPEVCDILDQVAQTWVSFSVQQNWPCNVSDSFCSRIGPFSDARDYKSVPEAKLFLMGLHCVNSSFSEPQINGSPRDTSLVTLVVGLFGGSEYGRLGRAKTGCNNGMTLAAEGSWDSKSGVLCMAACRGNESDFELQTTAREDCDVRICLYLPMALTILQRGAIVGNISSTRQFDANDKSTVPKFFHPLSFFLPIDHGQDVFRMTGLRYEYSKMEMALALWDRHEPTSNVRYRIPRATSSLFRYPSLGNDYGAYGALRDDLSVQIFGRDGSPSLEFRLIAINDTLVAGWVPEFSLAPTGGVGFSNSSTGAREESGGQEDIDNQYLDELKLLRVAGRLKVDAFADITTEGLYNPKSGKMYMMGCRDVKEGWSTLRSIYDLQQGLDCHVEVIIEYPAVSLIWIAPRSVKITISSTRTNVDPLYFKQITLSTLTAFSYSVQREGMITKASFEGALSVVTLSFMVVCILGQWRHMEKNPSSTAFISLLMLGIQAVAFAIPLITGAEALFGSKASAVTGFPQEGLGLTSVLYIGKVLTLIAFLLLAWLFEKVWKARTQTSTSQEWISVVSEKKVFVMWTIFHVVGIVVVLVRHPKSGDAANWVAPPIAASESVMPFATEEGRGFPSGLRDWQRLVLEYGGLVQDLFLLPQVFGGFTWKYSGKPVCKLYYVGITVLRLLPHMYDRYMRSHFLPDFAHAEHMYADPSYDFFSNAADIVIPVFSLVLAFVVWVQQSCSYAPWARFFSRSSKPQGAVSRWTTETELSRRIQQALSSIPENRPILTRGEDPND